MGSLGTKSRNHTFEQGSLVLWAAPDEVAGLEPEAAGSLECAGVEAPQACAIVIHTDGLCEPVNPGGIATAAWVAKKSGEVLGMGYRVVAAGKDATGNVAEYSAIIDALSWAADQGLIGVQIRSDSQICVNQIQGFWQVKSASLQPFCAKAQELGAKTQASFVWIPREQNRDADGLSVKAWEDFTGKRLAERYRKSETAKGWRRRRRPHKQAFSASAGSEAHPGEGAPSA